MGAQQTFKDWAGQAIPYRVRATGIDENAEPGQWITCEIDPHLRGEWHAMGRGKTVRAATSAAKAAWDEYDRRS